MILPLIEYLMGLHHDYYRLGGLLLPFFCLLLLVGLPDECFNEIILIRHVEVRVIIVFILFLVVLTSFQPCLGLVWRLLELCLLLIDVESLENVLVFILYYIA